MSSRLSVSILATVLAVALTGQPVRAQTAEEMAGAYSMTVVSKAGPCDTTPTFEVEVRGFENGRISMMLGGQPYSAPFDEAGKRFHLETADNGMGFRATMDGHFTRTADAVVLEADATWAVGCGGRIVGQHPAANTGVSPPPTAGDGEATASPTGPSVAAPDRPQTYTFGGASVPQPAPACPTCDPLSWIAILLSFIMFLLGLAVGWLLFHGDGDRRRRAEEAAARTPPPDQSGGAAE